MNAQANEPTIETSTGTIAIYMTAKGRPTGKDKRSDRAKVLRFCGRITQRFKEHRFRFTA